VTHDLDTEIEVAGQPTNDRQLLVVLLTEHGDIRPCRGEQLGHDGADTVEVARS